MSGGRRLERRRAEAPGGAELIRSWRRARHEETIDERVQGCPIVEGGGSVEIRPVREIGEIDPVVTIPVDLDEHLFRRESGRMVDALTRIFGVHNLALAEDVVQDTFCRALEVWKVRGIPENPARGS